MKANPKTGDDYDLDYEKTPSAKDSPNEKEFKKEPKIDPVSKPSKKNEPATTTENIFKGDKNKASKDATKEQKAKAKSATGEDEKYSADKISDKETG